jgi:hypothetical protein
MSDLTVYSVGQSGDGCPDFSWQEPGIRVRLTVSAGTDYQRTVRGVIQERSGKMVLVLIDADYRGGAWVQSCYPGELTPEVPDDFARWLTGASFSLLSIVRDELQRMGRGRPDWYHEDYQDGVALIDEEVTRRRHGAEQIVAELRALPPVDGWGSQIATVDPDADDSEPSR